jgi:hypothetical protein
MEVDTSDLPTSAYATLFQLATNSVDFDKELEWRKQLF